MLLHSLIIAIVVFAVDQVSKLIVLNTMTANKPLQIFPFLDLSLAHNHGAAFGIFANGDGWQRWFLIGVAVFISIVLLAWSSRLKRKNWWHAIALGIILGGAWGNMLDRLRTGHVTDFIDFHIENWHWYMFNFADIGICVGAFMLLVTSFRRA